MQEAMWCHKETCPAHRIPRMAEGNPRQSVPQGNSGVRLKKHCHLAVAPAKTVAAGLICIALTHSLWQRLHSKAPLLRYAFISHPGLIDHIGEQHARGGYGVTMEASSDGEKPRCISSLIHTHGEGDAKAMHSKISWLELKCAHCELCCQWK